MSVDQGIPYEKEEKKHLRKDGRVDMFFPMTLK